MKKTNQLSATLATAAISLISALPVFAADAPTVLPNPLGNVYDPRVIVGNIIKGVLGIIGSIALVLFIWGGIQIMISRGDSGKIHAGQETMFYAGLGLAVIFGSYAVTAYIIDALSKAAKS